MYGFPQQQYWQMPLQLPNQKALNKDRDKIKEILKITEAQNLLQTPLPNIGLHVQQRFSIRPQPYQNQRYSYQPQQTSPFDITSPMRLAPTRFSVYEDENGEVKSDKKKKQKRNKSEIKHNKIKTK